MKTIGEILINSREEKGLSVEQIAHETNISKSYINGLEQENFDVFPAEAYLIGFLRTYSEYLGLQPEKMISLYKNYKISEEPAPLEALVGKPKKGITLKQTPIIIVAVIALVGISLLLIKPIKQYIANKPIRVEAREARRNLGIRENIVFNFQEEAVEGLLEIEVINGDGLLLAVDNNQILFDILDDNNGQIELTLNDPLPGDSEIYKMKVGEERFLTLFTDSPDFRVAVKDYGLTDGSALLIVQKLEKPEELDRPADGEILALADLEDLDTPAMALREKNNVVILSENSTEKFTIEIKFNDYCYLRHKSDNGESQSRFYKKGDLLRAEGYHRIEIGASNAGSINMQVNGIDVALGQPGQISVAKIQWAQNETGTYDLLLLPLY